MSLIFPDQKTQCFFHYTIGTKKLGLRESPFMTDDFGLFYFQFYREGKLK